MRECLSIARAAADQGHTVKVFVTGEGVGLLRDKGMEELTGIRDVEVSFCDFNARKMGIPAELHNNALRAGSQLDNAVMVRDSDRVICL